MDDSRFDALTRTLAIGAPRRGVIKGIGGGVAVAVAGIAGRPEAAAAKCRRGKKPCRGKCIAKSRCCGNKDCATGEGCAKGKCVTRQGTCATGADSCANTGNPFCLDASGDSTCICLSRREGGTRCGVFGAASACDQCSTDDDCFDLGFPPGSSCTEDFGVDCPICQNDNLGTCILPCGSPDTTSPA
jgi:hypothetical protein